MKRWMWLVLPALFMSCFAIDSQDIKHYTFQELDENVLAVTQYAHWVINIDFTKLKDHLEYMETAKEKVYNAIKNSTEKLGHLEHPHLLTLFNIIKDACSEANHLYEDILLFYTNEEEIGHLDLDFDWLTTATTTTTTTATPLFFNAPVFIREKRQALVTMAAAGLGAVGGSLGATIFGLFSQSKVDEIATVAESNSRRIDDMIHYTNEVKKLEAMDIKLLASSTAKLTDNIYNDKVDLGFSIDTIYVMLYQDQKC